MRLYLNHVGEIEEENSEENEENEDEDLNKKGGNLFSKKDDNDEYGDDVSLNDFNTTFKSRKALNSVINDQSTPPAIRNLKCVALFLFLVLLAIAYPDYFITVSEFKVLINK